MKVIAEPKKESSWHDTAYIASYSATVKYLDDLAKEINQPAIINAIKSCFDPIIPITQYFIMGTKKPNQDEDFRIALLAGEIEDIIYSEKNELTIANSSYTKTFIKDYSKMYCKYKASNLATKKPWMDSFACEVAGIMIAASAKQLLNCNPLDYKFIEENLHKSLVEAIVKIPASDIKKDIIKFFDFNAVYVVAEYAYRVIGNSGKFIYSKAVENFYWSSEDVFPNNDLFQEDPIIDFSDSCSNYNAYHYL